jgi:hypothetical protein
MIKINFRIVFQNDVREKWSKASRGQLEDSVIDGFFEVVCNEKKYGLYFEEPLWEGETGQFRIDVWMEQFLKAAIHLEAASYCAIWDVETPAKWVEIKKQGGDLLISLVHCEFEHHQFIEYKVLPYPQYPDWKDERVLFAQFKDEIKEKSKSLLRALEKLNPEFLKVTRINEIADLAAKL